MKNERRGERDGDALDHKSPRDGRSGDPFIREREPSEAESARLSDAEGRV